jgi:S1-C subfamily serine protease
VTVDSSSNAWRSGLREGDIIVSVNRKRVIGAEEFATEIAKSPNRLVMDIVRNDQTILLTITASESSKPKAEH